MTHTATHPPCAPTIRARWPSRLGLGLRLASLLIGCATFGGSYADEKPMPDGRAVAAADSGAVPADTKAARIWMTVGERRFAVTLADTEAAGAFAVWMPLTLDMTDLHGNEKKFDLPNPLPANAIRPGTIRSGDLMLYGANTVVVFYLGFDSPYSYTRLGRADDPHGLAQALGRGDARVVFSKR